MLFAESQDFEVVLGDTWQGSLQVYLDDTESAPANLTGMSVSLLAWAWVDLAVREFSLTPTSNGLLTWAQDTTGWLAMPGRWAVQIVDGSGVRTTVAQGALNINGMHQPGTGAESGGNPPTVVSQLVAGSGVTLSPSSGVGVVEVTATAATGAVTSVFGRTGPVLAESGDYTVAEVTGAASLTYVNTAAAAAQTAAIAASDPAGAAATAQSNAEAFANNALATALAGLAPAEFPAATAGSGLTHNGIGQTVGGVVVTAGMRVLDTASAISAGLWVAASGAWTRPADFATGSNAQGKLVDVDGGQLWLCVSNATVTVDTTTQVWTELDASIIQAGTGLAKTGNTLALALTKALVTATGLTYSDVGADPAGAAATAQTNAEAVSLPLAGGTMSGAIAMGSHKITGLVDGTASTDGAAFGQIPLAGSSTPNMDGTGSAGSATTWSKSDHVHPTDTSRAPVASPTFTGTPTAPTAAALTDNTQVATTAYADSAVAVETTRAETAEALLAPKASPTFTGTTTAPEFSASGLTGATAASRYVGATASGAPASGTFAVGDFVIDRTAAIWVCTTAGSPGTWTKVGGGGMNYALFTSSGSWTIPAGVTEARIRAVGGGAPGGNGGAGATNEGTGGAAGLVVDQVFTLQVSDTSLTIAVAASQGPGGYQPGNTTTVTGTQSSHRYVTAPGGGGGGGGGSSIQGGYGYGGAGGGHSVPGEAGLVPMICVVGGAGGGDQNGTKGGSGGGAQQAGVALAAQSQGTAGGSATANGGAGQTATMPGCGGGGGGAAVTGSTGGTGGSGAGGQVEIWW